MPDLDELDIPTPLTSRERDVLWWTLNGLNRKQIAQRLGIGWRTVEQHLAHIYAKVGVHSRAELFLRMFVQ